MISMPCELSTPFSSREKIVSKQAICQRVENVLLAYSTDSIYVIAYRNQTYEPYHIKLRCTLLHRQDLKLIRRHKINFFMPNFRSSGRLLFAFDYQGIKWFIPALFFWPIFRHRWQLSIISGSYHRGDLKHEILPNLTILWWNKSKFTMENNVLPVWVLL